MEITGVWFRMYTQKFLSCHNSRTHNDRDKIYQQIELWLCP